MGKTPGDNRNIMGRKSIPFKPGRTDRDSEKERTRGDSGIKKWVEKNRKGKAMWRKLKRWEEYDVKVYKKLRKGDGTIKKATKKGNTGMTKTQPTTSMRIETKTNLEGGRRPWGPSEENRKRGPGNRCGKTCKGGLAFNTYGRGPGEKVHPGEKSLLIKGTLNEMGAGFISAIRGWDGAEWEGKKLLGRENNPCRKIRYKAQPRLQEIQSQNTKRSMENLFEGKGEKGMGKYDRRMQQPKEDATEKRDRSQNGKMGRTGPPNRT